MANRYTSDAQKRAKDEYESKLRERPGEYSSDYKAALDKAYDDIANRKPFSYDVNADALYRQYQDKYKRGAKLAMKDAVAQGAALTGGYDNSYAQTAGQQTYQGYMTGLADKIPELEQLAYEKYRDDGDDLYKRYSMLSDLEGKDYSRYRDRVSDFNTELERLYGRYSDERGYDYTAGRDEVSDAQWRENFDEAKRQYEESQAYQKLRDSISDAQWRESFGYQRERDAVSDAQWGENLAYQRERDAVSDAQWRENLDASQKQAESEAAYKAYRDAVSDDQFDRELEYKKGLKSYKGNSASDGTDGSGTSAGAALYPRITEYQQSLVDKVDAASGGGTDPTSIDDAIEKLVRDGTITEEDADFLIEYYGLA